MSTTPRDDNPQGVATFDPMTHPPYRALARRITDKYVRENGLPPWTWPEGEPPAEPEEPTQDAG